MCKFNFWSYILGLSLVGLVGCTVTTRTTDDGAVERKITLDKGFSIRIDPQNPDIGNGNIDNTKSDSPDIGNDWQNFELTRTEREALRAKHPEKTCHGFKRVERQEVIISEGKSGTSLYLTLPACTLAVLDFSASSLGISPQTPIGIEASGIDNGEAPASIGVVKNGRVLKDKLYRAVFLVPDRDRYAATIVSRKDGKYHVRFIQFEGI